MKLTAFAKFTWFTLLVNILVILGGAYVRATGAGAGCGAHWPLCNGELLPASTFHSVVEFSHRITSGFALLCVIVMLVWAWRKVPRWQPVHTGAVGSLIFIVIEALLGAGLVLLEYVAFNVSIERAAWVAAHLANTFLLLLFLTLTAWWATGGRPIRLRGQGAVGLTLLLALIGTLILGCSGAIIALGDTLASVGGFSPTESAIVEGLIGLRLLHPLLAFIVGALIGLAAWIAVRQRSAPQTLLFARWLMSVYVVQLLLGALNVALNAPVWIQLIHLLLADGLWILLVLLAASALAVEKQGSVEELSSGLRTAKDGFTSKIPM